MPSDPQHLLVASGQPGARAGGWKGVGKALLKGRGKGEGSVTVFYFIPFVCYCK